ncbi:MAG: tetratricopeptide repeat protein [Pseudomonadales bacterium]|nr:tetratricopeptide repeat protein [Pseudomonadales bacterium]
MSILPPSFRSLRTQRLARIAATALCGALLAACATTPVTEPQDAGAAATIAPAPEPVYRPFPEDTLYALLVAEFAARRGALDTALQNYMQQAVRTRDPGVAARATRMARYMGAERATLDAALLWAELEPQNPEARFTAATELARAGRPNEAFGHMRALDAAHGPTNFAAVTASALDLPANEREGMLKALQGIEGDSADLLIARAVLLQSLERNEEALAAVAAVLEAEPDNYQALLLEAQVYQNIGDLPRAHARIEHALAKDPGDKRLRLQYARLLAKTDLAKSEEQFRILVEQNPADAELRLALALVYRESGQFDRMSEELNALLAEGNQSSAAHFYLAQDAERRGDNDEAIGHYLEIRPGQMFMASITRAAELIIASRGIEALGEPLAQLRERWVAQALPLTLLESELRVEAEDLAGAQRLLDRALAETPAEPGLLYARSMVSEKRGDIAAMERDLRAMLRLDPDSALAMNALGYSLANLTDRLAEALALIQQALALKPDDPAIIDSMGWVQYRLGHIEEALGYLRQAFEKYPDHEVAAHLGEVLWVSGEREEARAIWDKGLESKPDSRLIQDTMRRLGAAAPP